MKGDRKMFAMGRKESIYSTKRKVLRSGMACKGGDAKRRAFVSKKQVVSRMQELSGSGESKQVVLIFSYLFDSYFFFFFSCLLLACFLLAHF